MNHDEQVEQRPPNRPPPRWNVGSVGATFVGFCGGVLAAMSAPHFRWFDWGFRTWLCFVVVGLIAAVIALVRAERLWGLTAVGLILNTALLFFLVWAIRAG